MKKHGPISRRVVFFDIFRAEVVCGVVISFSLGSGDLLFEIIFTFLDLGGAPEGVDAFEVG